MVIKNFKLKKKIQLTLVFENVILTSHWSYNNVISYKDILTQYVKSINDWILTMLAKCPNSHYKGYFSHIVNVFPGNDVDQLFSIIANSLKREIRTVEELVAIISNSMQPSPSCESLEYTWDWKGQRCRM